MELNDISKINQIFLENRDLKAESLIMGRLANHNSTGLKRTFFIARADEFGNIKRKFHASCQSVFGYSKAELETRRMTYFDNVVLSEIVNEREKEEYKESIQDLISGEVKNSSIYFNFYKHGELRGFYFDSYLLANNENEKVWITYITDVSNLNTKKFVLNDSLEKLGVCLLRIKYDRKNGKFKNFHNPIFADMFGIDSEVPDPIRFLYKKISETDPLYFRQFNGELFRVIDGVTDLYETKIKWNVNGILKCFSVSLIVTARVEEEVSLLISLVDITDLTKLKDLLRIKNHQLEEAFELTKSYIQVFDNDGKMISVQDKRFISDFLIQEEDYNYLGEGVYQVDWSKCIHKYLDFKPGEFDEFINKMRSLSKGKIDGFDYLLNFKLKYVDKIINKYYRTVSNKQPDGKNLMVITDVTDNYNREKELNRIRVMLEETATSANVGSFYAERKNGKSKFYAEDVAATLLGIKNKKNKIYKIATVMERINEDNDSSILNQIQRCYREITTGIKETCEITFKSIVKGETKWVRAIVTNVKKDEDNKVMLIPGVLMDVTNLIESEKKLYKQSITDGVTGGYNRNKWGIDFLEGKLDNRLLAFGDIIKFKYVNDFYGHRYGDWFLREVSKVLEFNGIFDVFRVAADRFVMVANEEINFEQFSELTKDLEAGIFNEELEINFSTNLTFAIFENVKDITTSEASVYSEKAIEKARGEGKKNIIITREYMKSINEDNLRNYQLVSAVKNKELFPYYQPIHDVDTGKIVAVEILARWKNDGKIISAFKFIDIINRLKVIDLLDMQMLEKAQIFYEKLIDRNPRNEKLSFTFNASKLSLTKFKEKRDEWDKLITKSNIPKDKLILELTEEIKIDDEIKDSIMWMNENNLAVAVDDYGSGESNISSLADPIIEYVKLDMSIIPKDKDDDKKNLILESFVSMFHRLGKSVCIEGVETKEQLEIVKKNNIELAQGYFYSKPLSGDELMNYLDSFDEL